MAGRELGRAEARGRLDRTAAAGRATARRAAAGWSAVRWTASGWTGRSIARWRTTRRSGRRRRAAHAHLELSAVRVPVLPHDPARGRDLEEAPLLPRAD